MVFHYRKPGLNAGLPLIDNSRKVLSKTVGFSLCVVVRQDEGGKQ